MEALGAELARQVAPGTLLFLHGNLGAGKTTLVRGFLRALGHSGAVRSPTYALVESYQLAGRHYHHFDLYRLGDPEELEFLGIRDYLDGTATLLVEWPERAGDLLPPPDLRVLIEVEGEGRRVFITEK